MCHTSFTNLPTTCLGGLLHSSYLKPRTLGLFRYSDLLMTRALVSTNERQVVRRLIDISDPPNGQILRSTFIQKGLTLNYNIPFLRCNYTIQLQTQINCILFHTSLITVHRLYSCDKIIFRSQLYWYLYPSPRLTDWCQSVSRKLKEEPSIPPIS